MRRPWGVIGMKILHHRVCSQKVEIGRPVHLGCGIPSGCTVPFTAEVRCGEASTNAIDEGSLRPDRVRYYYCK